MYELIEYAIRNHIERIAVPEETTQNDVNVCIRDILRNNPDIFWFSNQWNYIERYHKIFFTYTVAKTRCIKIQASIEEVVQTDFAIDSVARLPQEEQVMYIYKWIAQYCKYNIYSAFNQSICSVLVYRNSVCTGYAKTAQYLLKLLGIESKLVFGTIHNAEKGSRHCWLIVNINNTWYHLDPSFADPELQDMLLDAGCQPIRGANGLIYNCFCCDTRTIKQSRTIEDEDTLPTCNSLINYEKLQNIEVKVFRLEEEKRNGVKGCLLSDSGSTSLVYLWHSHDDLQKVVKIYRNDPSDSMMYHEIKISRELVSCSSVIHCYGTSDNLDGILLEQATPLTDLLCCDYYQLSAWSFCSLLLNVIEGLEDCLKHGLYYRDIHLNNIYRTSKGRYVLGDFGSCIEINGMSHTSNGGVGSPWYIAPETYLKNVFDEKSSTYGVGMLAYFLLNNLYPPLWNEYGQQSLEFRMQGHDLPEPHLLEDSSNFFEQKLAQILKKALSFEPLDRYQTLSEMKKAIKYCSKLIGGSNRILVVGGSSGSLDKIEGIRHEYNDVQDDICYESISPDSHNIEFASTGASLDDTVDSPTEVNYSIFPEHIIVKTEQKNGDNCSAPFDSDYNDSRDINSGRKETYCPKYNQPSEIKKDSSTSFWSKIFGWGKKKVLEDNVYSSVFAPSEVSPKTNLLVQVYLHLWEEADSVAQFATESDKNATRRDYIPLQIKLKRGDMVEVELNIYGEKILFKNKKKICWQGEFAKCSFNYYVPAELSVEQLNSEINLYVNGIPVGEMMFITQIKNNSRQLYSEIKNHVFKRVFISYAHQDSSSVNKFAFAYKALGVDYFFDRHALSGGDVFSEKIFEYIDSADLFILCWSENAAKSEYVGKELQRALQHAYPQISLDRATIKIYPFSIEPRADLPEYMKDVYNFEEISN